MIAPRTLPLDERISRWIGAQTSEAQAQACVRYALAFNTLDVTWLKDALSPFVTYDSQSVHRNGMAVPLRGRRAVMAYWSSKIETLLRNSDRRPRFELATTSNGDPCAAGCQPTGELDQNWLDVPIANLTLQTDTQGLITSALMITVAPNPATCLRSGIYPGIEDPVQERPRGFIRPGPGYDGLRFVFFLLDGTMGLDKKMQETARATKETFPGADFRLLVWEHMTESEMEELRNAQFVGFPAVAVYFRDQCVLRHQGLMSPESLAAAVNGASTLYVAAESGNSEPRH